MTIEEMLKDDETFERHFCSETTTKNLRGVPVHVLRKIIRRLHRLIGFETMASPRLYTPHGSEKTIVVTGNLTVDGKIRGKRLGVCADTAWHQTENAEALYIWADSSLLDDYKHMFGKLMENWVTWRKSIRYSVPIARSFGGDWEISIYHQVELAKFLSDLNSRYPINPNTLRKMRPTLHILGHSGDFISPAVIDRHRHPPK